MAEMGFGIGKANTSSPWAWFWRLLLPCVYGSRGCDFLQGLMRSKEKRQKRQASILRGHASEDGQSKSFARQDASFLHSASLFGLSRGVGSRTPGPARPSGHKLGAPGCETGSWNVVPSDGRGRLSAGAA